MVSLTFETVVPRLTSTRHVAASAFYHCLGRLCSAGMCNTDMRTNVVLATKDLLRLKQKDAYGSLIISIV